MPADITLVNLNMLFIRYGEEIERELHVPLGCLYLTQALEASGFEVDFRDYQTVAAADPFEMDVFLDFMADPAPVIGLSCMANLLPFTILAMEALHRRWPDRKLVLGGVGSKSVEQKLLERFPWIGIISRGEGEISAPLLLKALGSNGDLSQVPGISYRRPDGSVAHNAAAPRIENLDSIAFPAFHKIDLSRYAGYGLMSTRGCPYPCTFCSVAPVWNYESHLRSPANIVQEMQLLHREAGVKLFLFQDEFFVSGREQVMAFCRELRRSGLDVQWKAFGRVNLVDEEMMRAMADCGCLELRFGIESGSDRILKLVRKGFTAAEVLDVVPRAVEFFRRVDAFYIWGFPMETLEDFHQTLFQMVTLRSLGVRILPSLLSLLPQTPLYQETVQRSQLEFCPWLLPEFVFTGHEVYRAGRIEIPPEREHLFDLVRGHPDIFPGFYHVDLEHNVLPKLALLREFGFYAADEASSADSLAAAEATGQLSRPESDSCGAHSPRISEASARVAKGPGGKVSRMADAES